MFGQSHVGFVNSLESDVAGRLMLAGGADSAISIWDVKTHERVGYVPRHTGHQFGVSRAVWWPLDSGMFVTGSFDSTVSLWATEGLEQVYTFQMEHKVYCVDVCSQDGGENALVAVGMDFPMVRLLDLRAGAASHTLKGHEGRVLSLKWSPRASYLLATAGSDGTVRVWDIRQSSSWVASMDLARTHPDQPLTPLTFRRAHRSSVNGLAWTERGTGLVSLGNDNKARIWNLSIPGGINENVNFGPLVQNRHTQTLDPVLHSGNVIIPTDSGAILVSSWADGKIMRRLEPPEGERFVRQACLTVCDNRLFSGNGNGAIIEYPNSL